MKQHVHLIVPLVSVLMDAFANFLNLVLEVRHIITFYSVSLWYDVASETKHYNLIITVNANSEYIYHFL
jgi:hypothetical protein